MKNPLIVIFITVLVAACADTARITQDPSYGQVMLSKSVTAYVSVPRDGRYETKTYSGSGLTVTTIIRSSLLMHLVQVDEGFEVESYNQAILSAKSNAVDYLFFPTILHWEDRATEWSGIPDKAQIKIVIVDIKTSELISSTIIDGTSGIATFGGDHPQDLLSEPVTKFISGLFK
jgi:hypothetical protein